jgi:GDPmannose 4,6-dehydratase
MYLTRTRAPASDTANADAIGTLRLLEAIKLLGLKDRTRFYQASTSELYGKVQAVPQSETTPFYPRSPYAAAKLYAYWIVVNYREAYGLHASNGILFNHESPLRGETFVTRKVTRGVAAIALGLQDKLYLGNLDAERDWGHARDYVEGMWRMLQQDIPQDFVIATGESHSLEKFIELVFSYLQLNWQEHVVIDPELFRPADLLSGSANPKKVGEVLGWKATYRLQDVVKGMVDAELAG